MIIRLVSALWLAVGENGGWEAFQLGVDRMVAFSDLW